MDKPEILVCDCNSTEHQLVIMYDEEDNLDYVHINLNRISFWKRIKYLFGYQCKYGAFEEVILSKKHLSQLKDLVNKLEN